MHFHLRKGLLINKIKFIRPFKTGDSEFSIYKHFLSGTCFNTDFDKLPFFSHTKTKNVYTILITCKHAQIINQFFTVITNIEFL